MRSKIETRRLKGAFIVGHSLGRGKKESYHNGTTLKTVWLWLLSKASQKQTNGMSNEAHFNILFNKDLKTLEVHSGEP